MSELSTVWEHLKDSYVDAVRISIGAMPLRRTGNWQQDAKIALRNRRYGLFGEGPQPLDPQRFSTPKVCDTSHAVYRADESYRVRRGNFKRQVSMLEKLFEINAEDVYARDCC